MRSLRKRTVLCAFAAAVCGLCIAADDDKIVLRIAADDPNENSDVISSVAFSPDGQTVAVGYGRYIGLLQEPRPGQAILWNAQTGAREKTLLGFTDGVSSVAFSPDGTLVVAAGYAGDIKLWETATVELRRKIVAPGVLASVAFSPDGELVAAGLWVGEGKGAVQIWNVTTGEVVHRFDGHTDAVRTVAYSPDGKFVASGSMDGTARLWDVAAGKIRAVLTCPEVVELAKTLAHEAVKRKDFKYEPTHMVESVAFSPDGRVLAATYGELAIPGKRDGVGMVKLWDVATGKAIATFSGHKGFISDVQYSPDGRRIATAGYDGVIRVRNPDDHSEIASLEGYGPIAFSPDGNRLAVGTGRATITLVDVPR